MSFLDYAPAPESRAILNLRDEYGLFIDGTFVEGHGTPFSTISPANEEKIATISTANEADVDRAVAAPPAHCPATGVRDPVQRATSKHAPGMPFAEHAGPVAGAGGAASIATQPGATSSTSAASPCAAGWLHPAIATTISAPYFAISGHDSAP
jgi:hypothetical protein